MFNIAFRFIHSSFLYFHKIFLNNYLSTKLIVDKIQCCMIASFLDTNAFWVNKYSFYYVTMFLLVSISVIESKARVQFVSWAWTRVYFDELELDCIELFCVELKSMNMSSSSSFHIFSKVFFFNVSFLLIYRVNYFYLPEF